MGLSHINVDERIHVLPRRLSQSEHSKKNDNWNRKALDRAIVAMDMMKQNFNHKQEYGNLHKHALVATSRQIHSKKKGKQNVTTSIEDEKLIEIILRIDTIAIEGGQDHSKEGNFFQGCHSHGANSHGSKKTINSFLACCSRFGNGACNLEYGRINYLKLKRVMVEVCWSCQGEVFIKFTPDLQQM